MDTNPLICLDFDGVIWDTRRIFDFPAVEEIGFETLGKMIHEYRVATGEEFLPEPVAQFLVERGIATPEQAERLAAGFLEQQKRAAEYVFDDVAPFLRRFPREEIAILTRAHPNWQEGVVRATGLADRVSRVMVVKGDQAKCDMIKELVANRRPIIHIDDSERIIGLLTNLPDIHPIFLNRKGAPTELTNCRTLNEAAERINTILARA